MKTTAPWFCGKVIEFSFGFVGLLTRWLSIINFTIILNCVREEYIKKMTEKVTGLEISVFHFWDDFFSHFKWALLEVLSERHQCSAPREFFPPCFLVLLPSHPGHRFLFPGFYVLLPGLSHRIFVDVCFVSLSVFVFINLKLLLLLPLTYASHVQTKNCWVMGFDINFQFIKVKNFKVQAPLTFKFQLL